jgi:hypothetical protein
MRHPDSKYIDTYLSDRFAEYGVRFVIVKTPCFDYDGLNYSCGHRQFVSIEGFYQWIESSLAPTTNTIALYECQLYLGIVELRYQILERKDLMEIKPQKEQKEQKELEHDDMYAIPEKIEVEPTIICEDAISCLEL